MRRIRNTRRCSAQIYTRTAEHHHDGIQKIVPVHQVKLPPIDIIYVVGTGSTWSNNELRYSLRSVFKYLKGFRDIYIVGHMPAFIKGKVIYRSWPDRYGMNTNRNIYDKICQACSCPGISDQVLIIFDDHYLLQKVSARKFPWYQDPVTLWKMMKKIQCGNGYRVAVANTWTELNARKLPVLNYNVHGPALFDRHLLMDICGQLDWTLTHSFLIKSIYANWNKITGVILDDMQIDNRMNLQQLQEKTAGRPLFASNVSVGSTPMQQFLCAIYPEPSPVEQIGIM